jgi:hypothetical protein
LSRTTTSPATRLAVIVSLLCFVAGPTRAPAQTRADESDLKAAFVYNFAKFVRWPQGALAAGEDRLYVCVGDLDPFAEVLERRIQGLTAQSRTIEIQRWDVAREVESCNIVVFDATTAGELAQRREEFEDRHILTIAELEDFAAKGGIINFFRAGTNIRFTRAISPKMSPAWKSPISCDPLSES